MRQFSRRNLILSGSALMATSALAGCAGGTRDLSFGSNLFGGDLFGGGRRASDAGGPLNYKAIYGRFTERFPVEAFDYTTVDPAFLRHVVDYDGPEKAGSVVVDPGQHFLYFVEPGRRATRYGVGVGREGFGWSGRARINMKRNWPDWVPPREMVGRDPEIRAQLEPTSRGLGVPGGPRSPLGARAMYLFAVAGSGQSGDLGYRIHGTLEPWTVGTNVSSGCIRMINQDIIHLYSRVPEGTEVTVLT